MGAGVTLEELERIIPARFLSFSIPDPDPDADDDPDADPHRSLRIALLDSPLHIPKPHAPPLTAAMLVPRGRESDWLFSTHSGHFQLLLSCSPDPARLILIGDLPEPGAGPSREPYARRTHDESQQQRRLLPLLVGLAPKAAFAHGIPDIPFFSYEDGVTRGLLVDTAVGPVSGEMLVEDVEIDLILRRRLRFKRMPNLVQSQVTLLLDRPDPTSLLQPYLAPMLAALTLVPPSPTPRALCIGVGGGALLMFLRSRLGFRVLGVEADPEVLRIARRHFGLIEDDGSLQVVVRDGIHFLHQLQRQQLETIRTSEAEAGEDLFDAVMVDLDAGDARNGVGAPPLEFVRKSVLTAARSALDKHGILVLNVIPPDGSFYTMLIDAFREVFHELYELDVGNGENYILIATASPVASAPSEKGDPWVAKLKQAIGDGLVDSIKKIF